jgi:hypothetical protein
MFGIKKKLIYEFRFSMPSIKKCVSVAESNGGVIHRIHQWQAPVLKVNI